jgi:class 3 adenylate cyclase
LAVAVLAIAQTGVEAWNLGLHPGKFLVTMVALTVLAAFSSVMLWRTRVASPSPGLLAISTILDSVGAFAALLPTVVWPWSGYAGVLRAVEPHILTLCAAGAGLRLVPQVAYVGSSASVIAFLGLFGIDLALNGARDGYLEDFLLGLVYLGGGAGIGIGMAVRTRRLVFEGATAAADAVKARQRLGAYVSEEVAARSLEVTELSLGGERRTVTVLFSDLRGFTMYAESLPPERLVSELNAYLAEMVAVIRAEGGVIDKYIGDSIMAVFGIPRSRPDDAARAVRAAFRMRKALVDHNRQRATSGLPALDHGIGVNTGVAVVGNIGTPERMQYTVIGDMVNLASRLEEATRDHGVDVLVSEEAATAARSTQMKLPPLQARGRITIRGHESGLSVYSCGCTAEI